MAPRFGTSGLRGLVSELGSAQILAWTDAFMAACPTGGRLFVGQDLRPSSPRIATDVIGAAGAAGLAVTDCGALPTPALALAAQNAGAAAIMVTGSHIPADRNGLKFYTPGGEISKAEEAAILAALAAGPSDRRRPRQRAETGRPRSGQALADYAARYTTAFGAQALAGLRLGVYEQSSVARDLLAGVLADLGATVLGFGRSDTFVPLDTEAVPAATRSLLAAACSHHRLDAVLSTDGDADRPLLADAQGRILPGDLLGVLAAQALNAEVVCTPVHANSMIEDIPALRRVLRCRIGSPHVIAAMQAVLAADPAARVVGFEPNGGFLLGFDAAGPAGPLAALMTRDAFLPMLAPLVMARARGQSLADLVATLPARVTAADRLPEVPAATAQAFLARLSTARQRAEFLAPFGQEARLDTTEGLRMTLGSGAVVHLRASGNAPEFRVYTEADSRAAAETLLAAVLARVAKGLAAR